MWSLTLRSRGKFDTSSFFLFFNIFYFLTLQYCIGFAIYQNESATGIHVFPILSPPPSSFPIPSLWVIPVHQPQASSIVHRTWTNTSSNCCNIISWIFIFIVKLCMILPILSFFLLECTCGQNLISEGAVCNSNSTIFLRHFLLIL